MVTSIHAAQNTSIQRKRSADKAVPIVKRGPALHDELVSFVIKESIAKFHNDAQRDAFEKGKRGGLAPCHQNYYLANVCWMGILNKGQKKAFKERALSTHQSIAVFCVQAKKKTKPQKNQQTMLVLLVILISKRKTKERKSLKLYQMKVSA
ncbi:hypothetical protein Tco_0199437 [Tanacetum coccineum]